MPDSRLEELRSHVFRDIVRNVFRPYGATTLHRLSRGIRRPIGEELPSHLQNRDTSTFPGFMGVVEARGRRSALNHPGIDIDDANSIALVEVLSTAAQFEPFATEDALLKEGIRSWQDLVGIVSSTALELFVESHDGREADAFVSPLASALYEAVRQNQWPAPHVQEAFAISSPNHYGSLYYPIRSGELTALDLDKAIGDLDALTRLVNRMPSNPYKDIRFVKMPIEKPEKRRRTQA